MVKKKPSALCKGIPRADFMRQITRLPKKYSPEDIAKKAELLRAARRKQMEKNGDICGRVNVAYVAAKEREKEGVNLSEYRQSEDTYK